MMLATALAIVAVPIVGVAAFAVPLLPAPGRISVDAPILPDIRRSGINGAPEAHRVHALEEKKASGNETLDVMRAVAMATTTRTEFETVLTTSTVMPTVNVTATPSPTMTASSTRSCDLHYCDAGTSYCEYWGGYSSFDVSHGRPIPGETRTSIGVCTGITPVTETISSITSLSSVFSSASSNGSSIPPSTVSVESTTTSHSPLVTLTCMAMRE
ncbi:hypothetical protein SEPCBS57363_004569 [Sporothrix epigloea]|uniref:Uncharacterized protein n=1 Tax=Sporothrix epigloea TaxID=1892477 RepID=A0ABP0DVN5_9PEZI